MQPDRRDQFDDTLAFMFESRWRLRPTAFAMGRAALDTRYAECWGGLADRFEA